MTGILIPPEAIEAAAKAWVGEYVWQDSEDSYRADYMSKARAILTAAAPHMHSSWQARRDAEYMAAQDALSDEPAITLEDIEAIGRRNSGRPF